MKRYIKSNTKITASTELRHLANELCDILKNNNNYFFDYELDGAICTIIVSDEDDDGNDIEVARVSVDLSVVDGLEDEELDDEMDDLSMEVEDKMYSAIE